MKAERRHELETNDLAKKIIQAPDYFKIYGGRIALGIVVLVAVGMLINYRIHTNRENLAVSEQSVAEAREAVTQLASPNLMGPSDQVAMRRRELISNATQAIDRVNERSEDPKLLVQATVLRGDLYWTVANLVALPGATTREALAVEPKPDMALEQAEAAYKLVLENYSDQMLPTATARFGLAAIAENRGKWDQAKQQYEAINADSKMSDSNKKLAETRLGLLPQLEKGVYLTHTVSPSTQAATESTTQPAAH